MDVKSESITRRANTVLTDLQEEFKALYCRKDFQNALDRLERASLSSRPSRLRDLWDMLEDYGIEYEKRQETGYYKDLIQRTNIPDFLEDSMLYAIYKHFQEYPAPQEYMKRLVDRLSFSEDRWEQDTLRLRILKQFIKYGDYLKEWDFGGQPVIDEYSKDKQKKKKLNTVAEVLEGLDDGVFDILETATKAQKKPRGKYGLLKSADDLAEGKFREGEATRKLLYLFAMVYSMTYYSGAEGEQVDPMRDLERNLFQDYYTNNLMRFLSPDQQENLDEFELDPSGQAINYKNFAEMICLYYISRSMEPQEKLRKAKQMIDRVKGKGVRPGEGVPKDKKEADGETAYYRGLFISDILELREEAFETFLLENYNCDPRVGNREKGVFQLETEQNTAFKEYQGILQELEEMRDLRSCNYGLWFADLAAEKKNGLKTFPDRWKGIDREKYEQLMKLLMRMNSFIGHTADENVSTQNTKQEREKGSITLIKAFQVASPKDVTRTDLLVAYYYLYNALNEITAQSWQKSFREVFWDFKFEIDKRLRTAGYQELSGKNLLDVLVVFSAYARLNA